MAKKPTDTTQNFSVDLSGPISRVLERLSREGSTETASTPESSSKRQFTEGTAQTAPELRETALHRRQKVLRVTMRDLEDLLEYRWEEVLSFGVGSFFLSGAFWLAIEKYLESGWTDPALPFCGVSIVAGATLMIIGFRQMVRKGGRLKKIIDEIEEEEVVD